MNNFPYSTNRLLKKFDKKLNHPLGKKLDSAALCSYFKDGARKLTMLYDKKNICIISDTRKFEEVYKIDDFLFFEFKYTLFITEEESRYYKKLINQLSVKMEDYDGNDRIEIYFNSMEKIIAPIVIKLQEGLRQEIIKFGQKIIPFPINKIK